MSLKLLKRKAPSSSPHTVSFDIVPDGDMPSVVVDVLNGTVALPPKSTASKIQGALRKSISIVNRARHVGLGEIQGWTRQGKIKGHAKMLVTYKGEAIFEVPAAFLVGFFTERYFYLDYLGAKDQGNGFGSTLLHLLIHQLEHYPQQRVTAIALNALTSAIGFYWKFGFRFYDHEKEITTVTRIIEAEPNALASLKHVPEDVTQQPLWNAVFTALAEAHPTANLLKHVDQPIAHATDFFHACHAWGVQMKRPIQDMHVIDLG